MRNLIVGILRSSNGGGEQKHITKNCPLPLFVIYYALPLPRWSVMGYGGIFKHTPLSELILSPLILRGLFTPKFSAFLTFDHDPYNKAFCTRN